LYQVTVRAFSHATQLLGLMVQLLRKPLHTCTEPVQTQCLSSGQLLHTKQTLLLSFEWLKCCALLCSGRCTGRGCHYLRCCPLPGATPTCRAQHDHITTAMLQKSSVQE
jgi:hypothetical protein